MTRGLCPTCGGKGTIDNPKLNGPMMYCDQHGNSWPQIACPNCAGQGFTGKPDVEPTKQNDDGHESQPISWCVSVS